MNSQGKGITNFVSTGPKSYSFKYGDNDEKSAIKGFTLNHKNSSILNPQWHEQDSEKAN